MRTLAFLSGVVPVSSVLLGGGPLTAPGSALPDHAPHAASAVSHTPKERTRRTPNGARYRVRWAAPRRAVRGVNTLEMHVLHEHPAAARWTAAARS